MNKSPRPILVPGTIPAIISEGDVIEMPNGDTVQFVRDHRGRLLARINSSGKFKIHRGPRHPATRRR